MFLSTLFGRRVAWSSSLLPANSQDLIVGMTSGFTGEAAVNVHENRLGAQLAIAEFNAMGGLRGRRMRLVTLDDRLSAAQAAANATALITQHNALALLLSRGTACTQALLPVLAQHQTALVGPTTGAMVLHTPVNPLVFNVRAPYQCEAENAVHYLRQQGAERLALVHVDDSFGDDAGHGALKGLEATGLKTVLTAKFDRVRPDHRMLVKLITVSRPDALMFVGPTPTVADGILALRAAGLALPVVTLSNNASATFAKLLKGHEHQVLITQAFPSDRSLVLPMAPEGNKPPRSLKVGELTPSMLEGYIAAKVLTVAVRRLGPHVSPETVVNALNALNNFSVAGYAMQYSPANHSGFCHAELGSMQASGLLAPVAYRHSR
ncbi:MAG: ABC transporter substrate-binding protein [Polaromonas sp.]